MEDIWAIIPAYNEEGRLGNVVKEVKKHLKIVLVVDDGSKDGTLKEAKSISGIKLIEHKKNQGKGAALKTGCEYAFSNGAKAVLLIDSDGQHDPQDIPRLIKPLDEGFDIVFASRTLDKNMPVVFRFGNWVINTTMKLLYGMKIHDTQSGFRAFTKKAYNTIRWKSTKYSVESEMIAKAGKAKLKYDEIMIKTIYNDKNKGTTVLDGMKIVRDMIWWRISK